MKNMLTCPLCLKEEAVDDAGGVCNSCGELIDLEKFFN